MKIAKETNDNLIINITEKEIKKAFTSPEQLKNFKEDLFDLIGVYYQCRKELPKEI